ncbi:MAG: hypothetical protein IIU65_05610 [Clostridia bacterium]|nr:hypothetical protein [Clostridia bacterium]
MINVIKKYFNENAVVSIYSDSDDTAVFEVGYINTYNDYEVLLSSINKRGEYDGYILLRIEDIFHIEANGEYEEKVEKLYSIKNQKHEKLEFANDEIAYQVLDFAKENNLIVRFEFEDECRCGLVDEIDNNICTINSINDYGKSDGTAAIDIDKAETIAVDSDIDQDLKLLFESRN